MLDVVDQVAVCLVDVVERWPDDHGGRPCVDDLPQASVKLRDGVEPAVALEQLMGVALGRVERLGGSLCEASCRSLRILEQHDLDELDAELVGEVLQFVDEPRSGQELRNDHIAAFAQRPRAIAVASRRARRPASLG